MLGYFQNIITQFNFAGKPIYIERFGQGHINDTYALYCAHEFEPPVRYILQKINLSVFKNPAGLMENILLVTGHIRKKLILQGKDPERGGMTLIGTGDGQSYLTQNGECWRAYVFVDSATSWQSADKPEKLHQSGRAFGRFQNLLADFDAARLSETIPDFHNTAARLKNLKSAIKNDVRGRVIDVKDDIDFVLAREGDCAVLTDLLDSGQLPLRVTHNDTKLNNVLIDNKTGEGLCVIDLDTVMPGLSLYDFGDSIRFGANTAAEDERDMSKVGIDMALFEAFASGFLSETGGVLTPLEKRYLAFSAKLMTLECGIRFLTDYLNGDVYFKTHRPGHNLDRARCQFALVTDMENRMDEMDDVLRELLAD